MNVTLALDQHVGDEIAEAERDSDEALAAYVAAMRRVMELRSLAALRRAQLPDAGDADA